VDSLLTADTTPALTGTVDDAGAAVTVTVAGTPYAATNNGDGTWTLADNEISPALADGTYDVQASATDAAGNTGSDATTDELTVDTTAPAVARMLVSSTSWQEAFLDELGEAGYAVPTGVDQLNELPWVNVDQVILVFSEDVGVDQGDLAIYGVTVPEYSVSGFSYDTDRLTATWALSSSVLEADKLLLSLSDGVADAAGNALDGEWTDGLSTYASGNGQAGGDFNFRLNILPGDADQSGEVRSSDVIKVRRKGNTAPGDPAYSMTYDVDGSGQIRSSDVIKVRRLGNTSLPAGEPTPPSAPSALIGGEADGLAAAALPAQPAPPAPTADATDAQRDDEAVDVLQTAGAGWVSQAGPTAAPAPSESATMAVPGDQQSADDADLEFVDVLSAPELDPFAARSN